MLVVMVYAFVHISAATAHGTADKSAFATAGKTAD
jgi:hypothetical protein